MNKNANQPAFPSSIANGDWNGLTKRDYFAAMAMIGLLSNIQYFNPEEKYKMIQDQQLCKRSVDFADEMLSQLSSKPTK